VDAGGNLCDLVFSYAPRRSKRLVHRLPRADVLAGLGVWGGASPHGIAKCDARRTGAPPRYSSISGRGLSCRCLPYSQVGLHTDIRAGTDRTVSRGPTRKSAPIAIPGRGALSARGGAPCPRILWSVAWCVEAERLLVPDGRIIRPIAGVGDAERVARHGLGSGCRANEGKTASPGAETARRRIDRPPPVRRSAGSPGQTRHVIIVVRAGLCRTPRRCPHRVRLRPAARSRCRECRLITSPATG
jgi:hypothetical protein